MALPIFFNGVAREHFLQAALWYSGENPAFVDQLEKDIERSLGIISARPFLYPVVYRDVHRTVLKRFPYNLYYRIKENSIEILAILHHRQNKDQILKNIVD